MPCVTFLCLFLVSKVCALQYEHTNDEASAPYPHTVIPADFFGQTFPESRIGNDWHEPLSAGGRILEDNVKEAVNKEPYSPPHQAQPLTNPFTFVATSNWFGHALVGYTNKSYLEEEFWDTVGGQVLVNDRDISKEVLFFTFICVHNPAAPTPTYVLRRLLYLLNEILKEYLDENSRDEWRLRLQELIQKGYYCILPKNIQHAAAEATTNQKNPPPAYSEATKNLPPRSAYKPSGTPAPHKFSHRKNHNKGIAPPPYNFTIMAES